MVADPDKTGRTTLKARNLRSELWVNPQHLVQPATPPRVNTVLHWYSTLKDSTVRNSAHNNELLSLGMKGSGFLLRPYKKEPDKRSISFTLTYTFFWRPSAIHYYHTTITTPIAHSIAIH